MMALLWFVVVRKEMRWTVKFSIYQFIYVPTVTYGYELWIMSKNTKPWIQTAERNFFIGWSRSTLSWIYIPHEVKEPAHSDIAINIILHKDISNFKRNPFYDSQIYIHPALWDTNRNTATTRCVNPFESMLLHYGNHRDGSFQLMEEESNILFHDIGWRFDDSRVLLSVQQHPRSLPTTAQEKFVVILQIFDLRR